MYRVIKTFSVSGEKLIPGEVVEVENWKNINKLISTGYITVYDKEPAKCKYCGKLFVNKIIRKYNHKCNERSKNNLKGE